MKEEYYTKAKIASMKDTMLAIKNEFGEHFIGKSLVDIDANQGVRSHKAVYLNARKYPYDFVECAMNIGNESNNNGKNTEETTRIGYIKNKIFEYIKYSIELLNKIQEKVSTKVFIHGPGTCPLFLIKDALVNITKATGSRIKKLMFSLFENMKIFFDYLKNLLLVTFTQESISSDKINDQQSSTKSSKKERLNKDDVLFIEEIDSYNLSENEKDKLKNDYFKDNTLNSDPLSACNTSKTKIPVQQDIDNIEEIEEEILSISSYINLLTTGTIIKFVKNVANWFLTPVRSLISKVYATANLVVDYLSDIFASVENYIINDLVPESLKNTFNSIRELFLNIIFYASSLTNRAFEYVETGFNAVNCIFQSAKEKLSELFGMLVRSIANLLSGSLGVIQDFVMDIFGRDNWNKIYGLVSTGVYYIRGIIEPGIKVVDIIVKVLLAAQSWTTSMFLCATPLISGFAVRLVKSSFSTTLKYFNKVSDLFFPELKTIRELSAAGLETGQLEDIEKTIENVDIVLDAFYVESFYKESRINDLQNDSKDLKNEINDLKNELKTLYSDIKNTLDEMRKKQAKTFDCKELGVPNVLQDCYEMSKKMTDIVVKGKLPFSFEYKIKDKVVYNEKLYYGEKDESEIEDEKNQGYLKFKIKSEKQENDPFTKDDENLLKLMQNNKKDLEIDFKNDEKLDEALDNIYFENYTKNLYYLMTLHSNLKEKLKQVIVDYDQNQLDLSKQKQKNQSNSNFDQKLTNIESKLQYQSSVDFIGVRNDGSTKSEVSEKNKSSQSLRRRRKKDSDDEKERKVKPLKMRKLKPQKLKSEQTKSESKKEAENTRATINESFLNIQKDVEEAQKKSKKQLNKAREEIDAIGARTQKYFDKAKLRKKLTREQINYIDDLLNDLANQNLNERNARFMLFRLASSTGTRKHSNSLIGISAFIIVGVFVLWIYVWPTFFDDTIKYIQNLFGYVPDEDSKTTIRKINEVVYGRSDTPPGYSSITEMQDADEIYGTIDPLYTDLEDRTKIFEVGYNQKGEFDRAAYYNILTDIANLSKEKSKEKFQKWHKLPQEEQISFFKRSTYALRRKFNVFVSNKVNEERQRIKKIIEKNKESNEQLRNNLKQKYGNEIYTNTSKAYEKSKEQGLSTFQWLKSFVVNVEEVPKTNDPEKNRKIDEVLKELKQNRKNENIDDEYLEINFDDFNELKDSKQLNYLLERRDQKTAKFKYGKRNAFIITQVDKILDVFLFKYLDYTIDKLASEFAILRNIEYGITKPLLDNVAEGIFNYTSGLFSSKNKRIMDNFLEEMIGVTFNYVTASRVILTIGLWYLLADFIFKFFLAAYQAVRFALKEGAGGPFIGMEREEALDYIIAGQLGERGVFNDAMDSLGLAVRFLTTYVSVNINILLIAEQIQTLIIQRKLDSIQFGINTIFNLGPSIFSGIGLFGGLLTLASGPYGWGFKLLGYLLKFGGTFLSYGLYTGTALPLFYGAYNRLVGSNINFNNSKMRQIKYDTPNIIGKKITLRTNPSSKTLMCPLCRSKSYYNMQHFSSEWVNHLNECKGVNGYTNDLNRSYLIKK